MLAVLLALAAAVSYGASDYVAGLAARQASVIRVTVLAELANTALLLCVVPFVSTAAPSLPALAWGAAAGVSGAAGGMTLYLGFRHAAFSVASALSAVGSAAFSVLAGLLLGERPSALALTGIALALPAIAGVSASAGQETAAAPSESPAASAGPDRAADPAGHLRPIARGHAAGVGFGLIAGAAFGLFFIFLNRAGSASDAWPLLAADLTGVLTVTGLAAATRQLGLPPPGTRWLSVATGLTAAAGTFAFFLATHRGLLAVTAVITSLYPAGTIVLARVLLGERLTLVRLAGLGLAAVSVSLIAVAGVS